jgi:MFS family permease
MIFDYKNAIRSFNRNVKLMLAYYAVNAVANGIVAVLLNLYFLKLGLDENFLGSTVFVQSLGLGLLVLPFGMLADRVPKQTMVKAGFFMMNVPFTGFLFSRNPTVLLALFESTRTPTDSPDPTGTYCAPESAAKPVGSGIGAVVDSSTGWLTARWPPMKFAVTVCRGVN